MIASERAQNTIVVSVIIAAIVCSVFLVSNATYYGGTYSLAGHLNANLLEVRVSNIDHTNESIDPVLRLSFNLATTSGAEGNVRINYMGADVRLNNDSLSYMYFSRILPTEEQYLHPEFNNNYTMSDVADSIADRQAILDAEASGIWRWDIKFYCSFIAFDESGTITFREFFFTTAITTIV